jgi:hypothetical protein
VNARHRVGAPEEDADITAHTGSSSKAPQAPVDISIGALRDLFWPNGGPVLGGPNVPEDKPSVN